MKRVWQAMLIVLFAGTLALAQDKPPQEPQPKQDGPLSFYKIEYVLRELQDGKVINSRNYMMTIENGERGEAKVGARVSIPLGAAETVNWQSLDVGTNLSCRVVGRDDYVSLRTILEISNLPEHTGQSKGMESQLAVRQMRTEMGAVVPLGKQTVIGYMDDVNSTKRYEIVVTATKLK